MSDLPELERVGAYLWHWEKHTPDTEAIVCKGRRWTYAQLADEVRKCAAALIAAGCQKGDRIAMLTPPRAEFMIFVLAATEIGAIWVGLHPRYQRNEFRHVVSEITPKVLIGVTDIEGRDYRPDLRELADEFPSIGRIVTIDGDMSGAETYEQFLQSGHDNAGEIEAKQRAVSSEDTAVLIFTSGTTGKPKAAMIRHYGLILGGLVENRRWPSKAVRLLHNMPPNHIAGVGMMGLYPVIAGGTLVFMDRFDPGEMLKVIERERITFWLQAPTMFHLAVTHPDFGKHDLSSLEYMIWAGSSMPRDLVARLYELDATLATAFGMTELSLYATYSDLDADLETLSHTIGKPDPHFDIRVAKADGSIAKPGEEGEIQAHGPWLMAGYFNNEAATREAFTDDGWFHTGDVARVHEDGNLIISGRTKEMYISGGYNIYPREIEIAIEAHDKVAASAVIGIADDVFGETGLAFVQPEPGLDLAADEINQWCRQHLANYKVPKRIEIMTELPRLPIGKIDKQALKREFG